ncbi:hypothetical protein B0T21DRAFT_378831 [Apiosordaria backusii]|uniref:Uncharacterized protein n=1 Tax=Apiosordaria backusii TaxID=314023 RepID=A0AA39ZQ57_9PEZI|nr:hypothetical protein B0T21DRAFT_378831 [Apiosordaria backusii]
MEWPAETDPYLTTAQSDVEFFEYDCGLADENDFCLALTMHGTVQPTTDIVWKRLEDAECWDQWLESPVLSSRNDPQSSTAPVTKVPGFELLLSSPVPRAFEFSDCGSDAHFYLPISEDHWKKVIQLFHMHNSIKDAMSADKSYSSFLAYQANGTTVEMFTATMTSRDWDWNCSISATYFPEAQLTVGVIFNCHLDQKDMILNMLNRSPEVKDHPLLMLGLYCELQRDRADRLAKRVAAHTIEVLEDMEYLSDVTKVGDKSPDNKRAKTHIQLRLVISECKKAVEEIRAAKLQTKRITDDICEKSEASKQPYFRKATARYKCRFDQIQIELDGRMAQCRIAAEDLTYAGDRALAEQAQVSAEQAREEAAAAARQAKTGKVIAFLAMLYLPMTSIATIFAMPVFEFQNYWWDMGFHRPPPDTPKSGSDGKNAEAGGEVASGYFTLYLIISILLTVVTLVSYCIYAKESPTNRTNGNGIRNPKPGTSSGSIPTTENSMTAALSPPRQTQTQPGHNGDSLPASDLDEKRPILETFRSYFSRNGNGSRGEGGNGNTDGSRYRGRSQPSSPV